AVNQLHVDPVLLVKPELFRDIDREAAQVALEGRHLDFLERGGGCRRGQHQREGCAHAECWMQAPDFRVAHTVLPNASISFCHHATWRRTASRWNRRTRASSTSMPSPGR